MSFKQPPALHELQYDALGASVVDNPYLPASPIPSKNKVLNTSKPYVTGAINELLQTIENIRNLVQTSLSQQQAVLGDFISEPTLLNDLKKIDVSVLNAIVKLAKEIEGDLNAPPDISAIAPSIKEAILKLSATMAQAESAYEIWLALGNTGSQEDFLKSLKGEKGADGKDGLSLDESVISQHIKMPVWDDTTDTLTFTAENGETKSINLALDLLQYGLDYAAATKEIILTKSDETEIRVNVSDLIDIYTGSTGANIQITTTGNIIRAALLDNSVTEAQLDPVLRARIATLNITGSTSETIETKINSEGVISANFLPQVITEAHLAPGLLAKINLAYDARVRPGGAPGDIYTKNGLEDYNATWTRASVPSPPEEVLPDYTFTGTYQEVLIPPGTHLFELYGASGGGPNLNWGMGIQGHGGKGGYVKGLLVISEARILYIYPGQQGQVQDDAGLKAWNGGGAYAYPSQGTQGGGATSISLAAGNWDNKTVLLNRIAVAAGGGAGNWYGHGGAGGGLIGINSTTLSALNPEWVAQGGTQTSGGKGVPEGYPGEQGSFGIGADGGIGGGGGGYYGGGSGGTPTGYENYYGGAGGSSFISGMEGCDAVDENGNHTGQPLHFSGIVFSECETQSGVNTGHGFVKITLHYNPSAS